MTHAYAKPPAYPLDGPTLTPDALFCADFERCFHRVYAYVSKRVSDRELCERIVRKVLTGNVDLLAKRGSERHELSQLKAASDELIRSESAGSRSSGASSP